MVCLEALLDKVAHVSEDKAALELEVKRLKERLAYHEQIEREEVEAEMNLCAECRIVASVLTLEEAFNLGGTQ